MRHYPRSKACNAEKGAALITSIFALLLVTLLGMALMAVSEVARSVSTNDRETTESLYIADAGISHARNLIFGYAGNYDAILTANGTEPNSGDELSTNLFTSPITAGGHAFGAGSYLVRVTDDDDETSGPQNRSDDRNRKLIVTSVGRGRNGSTSEIEIVISAVPFPTLVVDGNLEISGNPEYTGSAGGVHSNGNMRISGNPKAEDFFSASGTLNVSGSPQTGPPPSFDDSPPDLRSGAETVTVPTLDPPNFRSQADYILGTDGSIRSQLGLVLGSSGSWNGWSYDSGGSRWVNGGDSFPSGTYYAEGGSIQISGSPGTSGSPITLSLIADGYVEISGNPTMVTDLSYAVIAGTDLKVNGNLTNPYTGTFYARHQISFSGNPDMRGQILAKNLADTSWFGNNLVQLSSGYMVISGNQLSNYNGGGMSTNRITSWREVRH